MLNIEMAGTNNCELCAKPRAMPLHVKTPIVFTRELADFERDLQPDLSYGDDLIAKPFLSTEMLVKVLTLLPGGAPGV